MDNTQKFSEELVKPQKLGLDQERLNRLKKTIESDINKGTYDGAVFIVARHGKIAMHEAVGRTDLEKNRQAKRDDVFFIMSITKQFTTTKVLMDMEKGKYNLNTPICKIIPEFRIKGKQRVTLGHLLTHTSGLNTEIPFSLSIRKLADIEAVVAAVSNERLLNLPETMVSYNAVAAFSLLGAMVQRTDENQRPFRQILKEDIFLPLGMKDTALGLPDELKPRIVPVKIRDTTPGLFEPLLLESMNSLAKEDTELPAGGAVSTALDVFRFSEMLRRGGELDGARILSPQTIKLATTIHTADMPNNLFDYCREMYGWPVFPANLGLSFFIRGEGIFPTIHGLAASPSTFAGLGAGSTMFWIDPERDLIFVFLSAGLLEEGHNVLRLQRLSDLVIASLTD
ncbi:MAG: class A beta-lactamase-related serine hydrolase [Promethearchaeota archaeon]|nr:MAG: class A beta-lactamase-related serine hydrolase [Candidatus Lokiarchaeota archaeon]